jgi:hypothetical protein
LELSLKMLTSGKLKYVVIICCTVSQESITQLCVRVKDIKRLLRFQMLITYVIPLRE